MKKGIVRGLLIGVILTVLVALYEWIRYRPATFAEEMMRLSNALFLFGLLVLIAGVIIFARFFSYRRREGLPNYFAMMRFRSREEHQEFKKTEEELNAEDKYNFAERGRDASLLIGAVFMLVFAILISLPYV